MKGYVEVIGIFAGCMSIVLVRTLFIVQITKRLCFEYLLITRNQYDVWLAASYDVIVRIFLLD